MLWENELFLLWLFVLLGPLPYTLGVRSMFFLRHQTHTQAPHWGVPSWSESLTCLHHHALDTKALLWVCPILCWPHTPPGWPTGYPLPSGFILVPLAGFGDQVAYNTIPQMSRDCGSNPFCRVLSQWMSRTGQQKYEILRQLENHW